MAETREVTYNAWGAFEHDRDLYALAYGRTVADLRGEIRARMDGDWNRMDRAGFWAMRKAELAAIVAEWATFERQNQREAVVTNPTPTARKVGPANSSVGASARSVAFMLTGGAPPTAMTLSSIPSVLPNYNGYVRPWTASRRGSR